MLEGVVVVQHGRAAQDSVGPFAESYTGQLPENRTQVYAVVMGNDVTNRSRDYAAIALDLPPSTTREQRMDVLARLLWEALKDQGVSWIGFYFAPGQRLTDGRVVGPDEMLLGPNRPKPACSPIGLNGVCGQVWRSGEPMVVRDVEELGENYVACDPRDRSEVVVPLFDGAGACWGVIDADSFDVGAFSEHDVAGLEQVCRGAGLTR